MYSAGILNRRVTIVTPGANQDTEYGRVTTAGASFEVWAAVDWSRGTKSIREGAMDAYDVIMVRCRWNKHITRDCKVVYNGVSYRIDSFHADFQDNTIQMTCSELQ